MKLVTGNREVCSITPIDHGLVTICSLYWFPIHWSVRGIGLIETDARAAIFPDFNNIWNGGIHSVDFALLRLVYVNFMVIEIDFKSDIQIEKSKSIASKSVKKKLLCKAPLGNISNIQIQINGELSNWKIVCDLTSVPPITR